MTAPGVLRVESKEGHYDGYSTMDRLQRGSERCHQTGLKTSPLQASPNTGLWVTTRRIHLTHETGGSVKEFNVLGPALLLTLAIRFRTLGNHRIRPYV